MQDDVIDDVKSPAADTADQSVETLADELKRLLVRYNSVLAEAGLRPQVQKLEHWVESQIEGPAPARIVSEGGIAWLTDLHDRLKLSLDELQRYENEGGNQPTKEQAEKAEELLKTIRRIEKIMADTAIGAGAH